MFMNRKAFLKKAVGSVLGSAAALSLFSDGSASTTVCWYECQEGWSPSLQCHAMRWARVCRTVTNSGVYYDTDPITSLRCGYCD